MFSKNNFISVKIGLQCSAKIKFCYSLRAIKCENVFSSVAELGEFEVKREKYRQFLILL